MLLGPSLAYGHAEQRELWSCRLRQEYLNIYNLLLQLALSECRKPRNTHEVCVTTVMRMAVV